MADIQRVRLSRWLIGILAGRNKGPAENRGNRLADKNREIHPCSGYARVDSGLRTTIRGGTATYRTTYKVGSSMMNSVERVLPSSPLHELKKKFLILNERRPNG